MDPLFAANYFGKTPTFASIARRTSSLSRWLLCTVVLLALGGAAEAVGPSVMVLSRANSNPTTLSSVQFTVLFTDNVTGVGTADFALDASGVTATIASVSPDTSGGTVYNDTYTITVSSVSGDGLLSVDVLNDGSIKDASNYSLSSGYTAGQTYLVDNTAPSVTSVTRVDTTPTNASSVSYQVAFSENVSGVGTADFSLTTSGLSGTSVTGVTGSGDTYTVTVNTGTGNGTLRLDVLNDGSIVDWVSQPITAGYTSGQSYVLDRGNPEVLSIVRASANPTNASTVDFTVTFNKSVTGVGSGDFAMDTTGLTGASVSGVSGAGDTYTVTINTGSGNGTASIDLIDDDSIKDAMNTPLGGSGTGNGNFTAGQTYTVDKAPPVVTSVTRASSTPASASQVEFIVEFSKSVTGVDTGDFAADASGITGASIAGVSGSGDSYTVTVNTGTGSGTLSIDVVDDDSIVDAISVPLGGVGTGNGNYLVGESYTMDKVGPWATSIVRTGTQKTNDSSVTFTVAFNEPVTGVDVTDFGPDTTGGIAGASVTDVTGSGQNFTVTLNTGTGNGTASVDLVDNDSIADVAGNLLAASDANPNGDYYGGEAYDVNKTRPVPTLSSVSVSPTKSLPITVSVAFDKAVTGFEVTDITTSSNANASNFASSTSQNYTFDLVPSGQGELTATIAQDVNDVVDEYGNGPALGTYAITYDTVAPLISSVVRKTPLAQETNATSVQFYVTFDEPVNGVAVGDFTPTLTGTLSGAAVASVTPAGPSATYTVTVDSYSGEGFLGLDVNTSGSIVDVATNAFATSFAESETYSVDATAPTVTSILRTTPTAADTNASTLVYTVTFSDPVSGVSAADFSFNLTGTLAGASVTLCSPDTSASGSSAVYVVTVSSGTGDGNLRLDITDDDSIIDAASNPLGGAGANDYTSGQVYAVDKTAPTVAMTVLGQGPTKSLPIAVTATFSEAVSGFDSSDITVVNASVGNFVEATPNTVWTFNLNPQGQGTVSATVNADKASDAAGNNNTAAPAAFTRIYDTVAPTVNSVVRKTPTAQNTNATSVDFTVTFSEPVAVAQVGTADFALTGAGATGASVSGVVADSTGTYQTGYTVSVTTGSNGSLRLDVLDDNSIVDEATNDLASAYNSGQTYIVDKTAPTVTSINRGTPSTVNTNAVSVQFAVTFSEAVSGVSAADFTPNMAGGTLSGSTVTGCTPDTSASGTSATYTVTVATGTGDGTLRLDITDDDSIVDVAANPLGGAGANNYTGGQTYSVDRTAPSVALTVLNQVPTNALPISVTVTFSESVTGFVAGDVTTSNASVTSFAGSGTTYTFNLTPAAQGTVSATVGASKAADAAGNGNTAAPAAFTRIYDTVPPSVSSIVKASTDPTTAASVDFTVTFSEAVLASAVGTADFTVTQTGTVTGSTVSAVAPASGDSYVSIYTVTVNSIAGDGTLKLNVTDDDTIVDAASNKLGGTGVGNGSYTGTAAYTIDNTAPTVTSINRSNATPTKATSVDFLVTFSESMQSTGMGVGDFAVTATGTAAGTVAAVTGSGTTRTVTVNSVSGDGTIRLDFVDDDSVLDLAANPMGGTGANNGDYTAGQTYTVDNTVPGVAISAPSLDPTNTGPVTYTITYTGASTITLAAGNVTLNKTGTANGTVAVTGSGSTTRTVTISSTTGNGTLGISLAANTATDAAGNAALAAGPSTTFTVDNVAPTVSIGSPSLTRTNTGPVTFTVTYGSASNVTLANGNVTLNATGTAAGTVAVTGSGSETRTVTISSITGNGTLGISLASGTASDSAGNLALAAGASTTFDVDNTGATVSSISRVGSTPTNADSVQFTVVFSEAVQAGTVGTADFQLDASGVTATIASVTGSGTTYTVTLSDVLGDGTLSIDLVDDDSIVDLVGNPLGGTGAGNANFAAGEVYAIDNTAPTFAIGAPSVTETNFGTINFTVTYTGASAVTLAPANVTLLTTGTATATVGVSGTGTETRTVSLTSASGNGTLGIELLSGTASDTAGNLAAASSVPSDSVRIDNAAPTVLSSVRVNANPTTSAAVDFTVTFSEAILASTVDVADFGVTVTGTVNGQTVSAVTPAATPSTDTFTVTVGSIAGDGTLRLNVNDNDTITDLVGNPLGGVGVDNGAYIAGAAYTIDNTAPTASVSTPSKLLTNTGPVTYTVTYSGADAVTLASGDVVLNTVGTAAGTVAVSGTGTTTRTITISDITGDGQMWVALPANTANDLATNPANAVGSSAAFAVDNTAPTLIIGAPSASMTNSGPVTFTVTYSGADTVTLANGDVTLNKTDTADGTVVVSGTGTTERTVTVSDITGDGTLGISIAAMSASDSAGNKALAAGPSATFGADNVLPTASIGAPSISKTSTGPVTYTITYTGADSVTLANGDVELTTTGTATGTATVSGTGTTERTVTVSSITGDGTIAVGLKANTASDNAGNNCAAVSAGTAFTADNTAPSATSITRASASKTNASSVTFAVVFSEPVLASAVGTADFAVAGTATGASVSGVTPRTGDTYQTTFDVAVTTGSVDGSLRLDLVDDDSIVDDVSNPVGGAGAANGNRTGDESYTVDKTPPTVSSVVRVGASPTKATSVDFTVTFSEAVTGVTNVDPFGDFAVSATDTAAGSVSAVTGSGTTYTVTVGSVSGNGDLRLDVADDDTIVDDAGNKLGGTGEGNGDYASGQFYVVDNTAPTLSIGDPVPANTNTQNVVFTVTYSGADAVTLSPSNITLNKTGTASGTIGVSGSGTTTRTVTLTDVSGDGTVGISIASGTASDSAGNLAASAGPSATAGVDNTIPTISVSGPSQSLTNVGPVTFTVTYGGVDIITLSPANIVLNTTGTAAGTVTVDGTGTETRTVHISSITGNGTIGISIVSGTARDLAGNSTPSAGATATFNVDNQLPSVTSIVRVGSSPTKATSVAYDVTFSESVTGVDADDFELTATGSAAGTITGVTGSAASYRVAVGSVAGDGTLRLDFVDDDSVTDAATNVPGGAGANNGGYTAGEAFVVDNTAPTLAIGTPSAALTNFGPVTYTINYANADFVTLAAENVSLQATGTASAQIAVTGSGLTTRTVTLSSITGTGTLGISIASATASDQAGNSAIAAGPSDLFAVDNTAPAVLSITRAAATPTKATSVTFNVVFTEVVTGVSNTGPFADFSLNLTGTATGNVSAVTGSGDTYTVTVSGVSGNGDVRLDVSDDDSIIDAATNPLGGVGAANGDYATGEAYTVDNIAPTITADAPSAGATNTGPVTYAITYGGADTITLAAENVTLNSTGTAAGTVSVSGTGTTERTITVSGITGNGSLWVTLASATASDLAGNTCAGIGSTPSFLVDNIVPTVAVGAPSASLTRGGPVSYTVTYAGANTITLAPENVTLNTTGTATGTVTVSGTGSTTRTVSISGITGDGTLGISLASATGRDNAGNVTAATSASTTFTVDNTATLAISAPTAAGTTAGPVSYTLTYTGVETLTLGTGDITLNKTGTANGTVAVSGTGLGERTVSISDITGDGTLGITVASGTGSDTAGNIVAAAGPSGTFVVDNTRPTISVSSPSVADTISGPVTYTVTYGGATSVTLAEGDITLDKTGTADGVVAVSGTGLTERTITISSITGNGTLGISVASGTATDDVANAALAAGPSTTFNVDHVAPTVSVGAPSASLTRGGPITYSITYAGADAVTLAEGDVTLNKTGTANGTVAVSGTGLTTRTVTISSITGDGSLGISLAAETASDIAGNKAAAAGPSTTFGVDNTAPTIAVSAPSSSLVVNTPVTYTVTYSGADAITLAEGNITLNKTGTANGTLAVTGTGTTTRTVTISSITGDGTLGITLAAATASDNAGNTALAAGPSATVTVDNTSPTIAISGPSTSLTNTGPVTYTVTYSGANAVTLGTGNITLNKTDTANGTVSVSGTGTTSRTVTISSITGNGTLGISIAAATASDTATNTAPAAGPSTTFGVDNTLPSVSIGMPSSAVTRGGPVTFTLTYANVTEISLVDDDIALNAIGTAAASSVVVSGSGLTERTVTLSGITGDGTLDISVAANTAHNLLNVQAGAAGPSAAFDVDNTQPLVAISAPSSSLVSTAAVTYTVTYSGADAITLGTGDITLNKTGTANGSVAVSGTGTTTRTVTISDITGDGTLGITLAASTASDDAGNLALAAGPSTTFGVDNTVPTLVIGAPSQSLANTGPVTYTVTYSGADSITLDTDDVTLNKTGTADGSVAVSGTGTTSRTVTISSITGSGTLGISIASVTASDNAGNDAQAAGPSTTFDVDNNAPTVNVGTPSTSLTRGGPVTYAVTYIGADAVTLGTGNITLNKTGTANGTVAVSGTGLDARTVTISGITGDGTLGISLASATASDTAGNTTAAAGPSATFNVDNTAPGVSIGAPSASLTTTGPVTYTVTYTSADAVTLGTGDVTLIKTGTANGTVAVSGTGTGERTVTISTITGTGTLGISLVAGTASDNAGNTAASVAPSATFGVDNTAPTLVIGGPSSPLANTGPVTYTVTYTGASAVTLAEGDITLNKTDTADGLVSVSGTGATSRTVTISGITGNGTLGISIAAATASDAAGNAALAAGPSTTFTVDNNDPQVGIGSPSALLTQTGPVSFTLTYVNVTEITLVEGDVTINATGSAAASTVVVSGTGLSERTVTLSDITGDGTLGISLAANTAHNALDVQAGAAGPSDTFEADNTAPGVSIGAPSASLVTDGPVSYAITYTNADAVTLGAGDITLSKTGTANGTVAVSGTGLGERTVTISDITGTGSLGISLASATASDNAGNASAGAGPSATFSVDNTPPTVAIGEPSLLLTNFGPVDYTITYVGSNTPTLSVGDVTLNKTGTANGTVSVSGAGTSTRTITISSITGIGTLGISIAADTAFDDAGNSAAAAGPSTVFSVDNTIPSVSIGAPSTLLTTGGPVTFALTYTNASAITLTENDITVDATGSAAAATVTISGTGLTERTVTLSDISGDGTLGISVAADTAHNALNVQAAGVGPSATFDVDNTRPIIGIGAPSASLTTVGPIAYVITYTGADVVALTEGDVMLNKTGTADGTVAVSGTGTAERIVTISGISGTGMLGISLAAATASDDAGNNAISAGPSATFAVDNTPPTLSIGEPSVTLANTGPVDYTITYVGANTPTLSVGDITLNKTGTANGTVSVTGTGTSVRTVTISSITGDGTLGISIAAGTASDDAGNTTAAAGPSSTFNVDNTVPGVSIGAPSAALTSTAPVSFTLTYVNVTTITLAEGDITVNATGSAEASTVAITGTGLTTRTVTLSGISGTGTLGISVAADTAHNALNVQAGATGPSATFDVDNTAPTLNIGAPSASLTNVGPITYTVTYSGATDVYLLAEDVVLNTTGTATGTIEVSGTGTSARTVTISAISGEGTLGISIEANTASDDAGNTTLAAGPSATFAVENTAPTIAISDPSLPITNVGPVTYTISYTGADFVTLDETDIALDVTGTATGTVTVSGAGLVERTVTISDITGDGALGITIAADTAQDLAGNKAAAAGPSATFDVDNTLPQVVISEPSVLLTGVGPVTYTLTYLNVATITLTEADIWLDTAGTANGVVAVTTTGTNERTVTITDIVGDGWLGISVKPDTAEDLAGNKTPAAGPSTTFVVDNTNPQVVIGAPSQTVTSVGPVSFTLSYLNANSISLVEGDITVNATDTAEAGTVLVSGTGLTERTVTLSDITGNGTLSISVAEDTARDSAGNMATATGPSDTFIVDNIFPQVIIGAPSVNMTKGGPVTFTLTYLNSSVITLAAEDVILNSPDTATGFVSISVTGASERVVTLYDIIGDGKLGISIAAGTAEDENGLPAPAAGPSDTFDVDNTAPAIQFSDPIPAVTAAGPVSYTLTYAGANTVSLGVEDITLETTDTATATVAEVLGTGLIERTVTLTDVSGDGTIALLVGAGTATDVLGNTTGLVGPSPAFEADNTPPVIEIGAPSANITNSGPVDFTVTYIGANTAILGVNDVSLVKTGTADGVLSVSGEGSSERVVSVSDITGDGTLGILLEGGMAADIVGNTAQLPGPSDIFTVDNIAPTAEISGPSIPMTNAGPVSYVVTYSGANAITLEDGDVILNATGTASGSVSVSGTGLTERIITVSDISGNGEIGVTVVPGTASDAAGNTAGAVGPSETFTVDSTLPLVTISAPSASITATGPVSYILTYSNVTMITLVADDIELDATGTATGTVSVSETGEYERTVTISDITGDGTLGISVVAGTAVNALGIEAPAAGPSDTFEVNNTTPMLTIGAPSATITSAGPVSFELTYDNVTEITLAADDVALNATGTAAGVVAVSGTGLSTRTVTISGITGDGTLGISVAADTASNAMGALAPAAGPSDTFVVDNTNPQVAIGAPSQTHTNNGPVSFTLTYLNVIDVTLSDEDVTLNVTGSAAGEVSVSGSGVNERTVTISNITGDGSLGISIAAGTAVNALDVETPAAGPSTTFVVDNTSPTVVLTSGAATLTNVSPVPVIVTFDASVSGFALGDIEATNGVASNLVGSGANYAFDLTPSGDGQVSAQVIAAAVTDVVGNESEASNVLVRTYDGTAPVIELTGEAEITLEQGAEYEDAGATAMDEPATDLTDSIAVDGSVNTSVAGVYEITYTVSDAAGNAATPVTRTVTIVAAEAPLITLNGNAEVTIECGGVYAEAGATAEDNVDGDISDQIVLSGDTVDVHVVGVYEIDYDVADAVGNEAVTVTRTVNVVDNTPPVIVLEGQQTITIACGAGYTDAGATATDACEGDLTDQIISNGLVDANVPDVYTITYAVMDGEGNMATPVIRTVTVEDSGKPQLTLNGAATVYVEVGGVYTELGATALDGCEGNLNADIVVTGSVDTNALGSQTITYTVEDSSGNSASVDRTVVVRDTVKPVITVLGANPMTLSCGAAYTELGATATDTHDGSLTAMIATDATAVDTAVNGRYEVVYTVSDQSGNEALAVRTVLVSNCGGDALSGTVRDMYTQTALEGVAVELFEKDGTTPIGQMLTDAQGAYFVARSAKGVVRAEFTLTGYAKRVVDDVSAPAVLDVNLAPVNPNAVTGLAAAAGASEIALRWRGGVESDLAGYNVYRAEGDGEFAKVNSTLVQRNRYADATVAPNKIYRYYVTSVDADENESGQSEIVQVDSSLIVAWVGDVTAAAGTTARVAVSLASAEGISAANMRIELEYPSTLVDGFIEVKSSAITEGVAPIVDDSTPGSLVITTGASDKVLSGNGSLFNVYFPVLAGVADGCDAVRIVSMTLHAAGTPDTPLAVDLSQNGRLCAGIDCLEGDVDGDGIVSYLDIVATLQLAVGLEEPTDCQWQAADLNSDRIIDSADAVLVLRLARGEDIDPPTAAKADAKAGEIVVTADTLDAERGQTVTIPITITNATALRAFDAVISYEDDPSLLALESAEAADDIADVQYQTNVGAGFASLSVCWPSAPVADITLVNLVFRVADTAAIGGSLPILISDIQLKGEYGQDLEWAEAVSVVNGAINVVGAVIEGEPLEGQPLEGQPLEGQPLEGQPLEGQPVEGEPLEGQPVEGEPLEGQPVEGEPLEGQPVEGQPLEGQPVEGEPLEGQPVEGQPLEGEVIEGEPLEGQPAEGEVIEGEPLEGQPVEGQPAEGQPAEGQPAEGQPAEGQQVVEGQPADEGQAVAPIEGEPAPASKGCFG